MAVRLLSEMIEQEKQRAHCGTLKVFFGSAAGVGKTYAMLEAARVAKERGVDVVAGWIKPRDRPEPVHLAEGLPSVPTRSVPLDGRTVTELDLDAVLGRRPAVVLVDELAHTNAPGSKNQARWQDVLDLLDAGIDVFTTMNVHNIESLKGVVGQVTGFVDPSRTDGCARPGEEDVCGAGHAQRSECLQLL